MFFLVVVSFLFFSNFCFAGIVELNNVSVEIINKITTEKKNVSLNTNTPIIFENILISMHRCIVDEEDDSSYAFIEVSFSFANEKKIFSGWLSSKSISFNSVENNVYDINIISNCY